MIHVGDQVEHEEFGIGQVLALLGETATVEYNPFDNFVTISYYVDEEQKERVDLRLTINDNKL